MMSSDNVIGWHKHCTQCKGSKVDVIQTGFYYCASCWMSKYAQINTSQLTKRRVHHGV